MSQPAVPLLCSWRMMIAVLGCLAFINMYAMRINMSVSIVCMVNHTHLIMETELTHKDMNMTIVNHDQEDKACVNNLTKHRKLKGEYPWTKETQGIILGAFYWGYLLSQFLSGVLSEHWGGKNMLSCALFICMVATFLTPISATVSPYMVVAVRIVIGFFQGSLYQALFRIWSKWAPPLERTKLIGFTFAGAQIGNIITLQVSGLLCNSGFANGWPSIFYICGLFGLLTLVLWIAFVADSPSQHRFIKATEREYIETSIGMKMKPTKGSLHIPLGQILKSLPVWAACINLMCSDWGLLTMTSSISIYMHEVLKFDIKENGLLSAVPFVVFWLVSFTSVIAADVMRVRGWRTAVVRKIAASAGSILPSVFLVVTGYITCHTPYVAVVLLTIGVGANGFRYSGVLVNFMDIAPPFAATLSGIANTFASVSGIVAPYVVSILTPNRTREEWQVVFYVAAGIYMFGAFIFLIFAEGEVQDWAKPLMEGDEEKQTTTDISAISTNVTQSTHL